MVFRIQLLSLDVVQLNIKFLQKIVTKNLSVLNHSCTQNKLVNWSKQDIKIHFNIEQSKKLKDLTKNIAN